MEKTKIEDLIQKYYNGETSPEEELILHLVLLDLPEESEYRKHLKVLEGLMGVASSLPAKKQAFKIKKWMITLSSSAAAVILLFVGITLFNREDKRSYVNGEPIAQEEVNKHTQMVFRTLDDVVSNGMQARDEVVMQLSQANDAIENAWSRTSDIIEDGGMIPTNY